MKENEIVSPQKITVLAERDVQCCPRQWWPQCIAVYFRLQLSREPQALSKDMKIHNCIFIDMDRKFPFPASYCPQLTAQPRTMSVVASLVALTPSRLMHTEVSMF